MDLEELRNDWNALGNSTKDHNISAEQINAIIKSKHRSIINKILIFEILIPLVYLYFVTLTIFRFDALETLYLKTLGIVAIVLLGLLVSLRLIKINTTYHNRFLNYTQLHAIKKLVKQNIEDRRFYLINIVVGFFLTIVLIILNIKIYNEFDLIQSKYFWFIIIPGSLLFILLINNWIRKYYSKIISSTEALLQEIK